jgi:hypothetical protein
MTDLEQLAARLFWWRSADAALRDPARLLAQVMVYGTPEDLAVARRHFPESAFRDSLAHPPPGLFDPRSWAYWHVVFGLDPGAGPPRRQLPDLPEAVSAHGDSREASGRPR